MGSIADWGLFGLFVMSFLAATVVPVGSETLFSAMLIGGYSFWPVVVVGSLGNWLGGMLGYYMGYLGKWEWIEKYLRIKRHKVEGFQQRIAKHGSWLALICWLPAVGDFIAIGLGLFKANWRPVAVFMFLGKFLRFIVWAYLTVWVWNGVT